MRASNGLRTAEAGQRSATTLLFGGIFLRLFEKRDRTAMQTPDNPLERLEHELGEFAKKADERLQENESGVGIGAAEFSAKPARGLDPRLLLLQRRTEARGVEHWLYRMETLHQEQLRGRGWSFVRITFLDGRVLLMDLR